jgi:hypothetical protein
MVSDQTSSGSEAHEIMAPLCVTGRSQTDCTTSVCLHQVVMFFIDLYIAAEFELTVLVVVDRKAVDDTPGATNHL